MILKGEKVILRPIRMDDAPRFVKWLSDPEVNQYTTRRSVSLKDEKEWIKNVPKRKYDKVFAIDAENKIHIGSISLHNIVKRDKNCTIGIFIGDKRFWDKGYGTDAMKTLMSYAFSKLDLNKINLINGVHSYNPRAIKVYKKIGFKTEGKIREWIFHKGKFHDLIQMGILKSEWQKRNY